MKTVFKNVTIINEGKSIEGDLLVENHRISKIGGQIDTTNAIEIDGTGKWLMPGIIDDQVHFREPGLTYKADIHTESRAAAAGGVTTFFEMPNTKPAALTQSLLQDKYDIAEKTAYTNYSFFMGASNDNLEEVLKTNGKNICGVKIFMGSSTGNMLVDNTEILDSLFRNVPLLIATHCEDEATIRKNTEFYLDQFGEELDASYHPIIRNTTGCLLSSSLAVDLAKRYNTRLHILHISTQDEIELFTNDIPLSQKRITSEVCVHHLYFDASQYATLGNKIKCNPAIKEAFNKEALFQALLDDKLDIIATDHAPHTLEEKNLPFMQAPSGLPLVQHSLNVMLDFYHKGMISKERIIEKMCHAPAQCFNIEDRGYLREGYYADMVLVDPDKSWTVHQDNILYKCGWSPLEGKEFTGSILETYVNGYKVYDRGQIAEAGKGMRCTFSNQ